MKRRRHEPTSESAEVIATFIRALGIFAIAAIAFYVIVTVCEVALGGGA